MVTNFSNNKTFDNIIPLVFIYIGLSCTYYIVYHIIITKPGEQV